MSPIATSTAILNIQRLLGVLSFSYLSLRSFELRNVDRAFRASLYIGFGKCQLVEGPRAKVAAGPQTQLRVLPQAFCCDRLFLLVLSHLALRSHLGENLTIGCRLRHSN